MPERHAVAYLVYSQGVSPRPDQNHVRWSIDYCEHGPPPDLAMPHGHAELAQSIILPSLRLKMIEHEVKGDEDIEYY